MDSKAIGCLGVLATIACVLATIFWPEIRLYFRLPTPPAPVVSAQPGPSYPPLPRSNSGARADAPEPSSSSHGSTPEPARASQDDRERIEPPWSRERATTPDGGRVFEQIPAAQPAPTPTPSPGPETDTTSTNTSVLRPTPAPATDIARAPLSQYQRQQSAHEGLADGASRPSTPAPPPPRFGRLTITANPFAHVSLDKMEYGDTPLSIELPPGTYFIRFTHPHYVSVIRSVHIDLTHDASLFFDFERQGIKK